MKFPIALSLMATTVLTACGGGGSDTPATAAAGPAAGSTATATGTGSTSTTTSTAGSGTTGTATAPAGGNGTTGSATTPAGSNGTTGSATGTGSTSATTPAAGSGTTTADGTASGTTTTPSGATPVPPATGTVTPAVPALAAVQKALGASYTFLLVPVSGLPAALNHPPFMRAALTQTTRPVLGAGASDGVQRMNLSWSVWNQNAASSVAANGISYTAAWPVTSTATAVALGTGGELVTGGSNTGGIYVGTLNGTGLQATDASTLDAPLTGTWSGAQAGVAHVMSVQAVPGDAARVRTCHAANTPVGTQPQLGTLCVDQDRASGTALAATFDRPATTDGLSPAVRWQWRADRPTTELSCTDTRPSVSTTAIIPTAAAKAPFSRIAVWDPAAQTLNWTADLGSLGMPPVTSLAPLAGPAVTAADGTQTLVHGVDGSRPGDIVLVLRNGAIASVDQVFADGAQHCAVQPAG